MTSKPRLEAGYSKGSSNNSGSLYDAAAGRIRLSYGDADRVLLEEGLKEAVAPDDLLMKHLVVQELGLPVQLEDHPELPDDSLLKAIHYYVAQYCQEHRPDLMNRFKESMLLSLGIIFEEELKKLLGSEGHLFFAEKEEDMDPPLWDHESSNEEWEDVPDEDFE